VRRHPAGRPEIAGWKPALLEASAQHLIVDFWWRAWIRNFPRHRHRPSTPVLAWIAVTDDEDDEGEENDDDRQHGLSLMITVRAPVLFHETAARSVLFNEAMRPFHAGLHGSAAIGFHRESLLGEVVGGIALCVHPIERTSRRSEDTSAQYLRPRNYNSTSMESPFTKTG
jgi:hypothetical protein